MFLDVRNKRKKKTKSCNTYCNNNDSTPHSCARGFPEYKRYQKLFLIISTRRRYSHPRNEYPAISHFITLDKCVRYVDRQRKREKKGMLRRVRMCVHDLREPGQAYILKKKKKKKKKNRSRRSRCFDQTFVFSGASFAFVRNERKRERERVHFSVRLSCACARSERNGRSDFSEQERKNRYAIYRVIAYILYILTSEEEYGKEREKSHEEERRGVAISRKTRATCPEEPATLFISLYIYIIYIYCIRSNNIRYPCCSM